MGYYLVKSYKTLQKVSFFASPVLVVSTSGNVAGTLYISLRVCVCYKSL